MSTIPALDYDRDLFLERTVRSVTANTRADGEELLALASRLPLVVHTTAYAFDLVDVAMADLAGDRVTGSIVIKVSATAETVPAKWAARKSQPFDTVWIKTRRDFPDRLGPLPLRALPAA